MITFHCHMIEVTQLDVFAVSYFILPARRRVFQVKIVEDYLLSHAVWNINRISTVHVVWIVARISRTCQDVVGNCTTALRKEIKLRKISEPGTIHF